jgi:tetratricopeptide (TPR) repeat protein
VSISPENAVVYSNLGLVYRKMGNFEKAIEVYSQEIDLTNNNPKALNKRAFCHAKLGMYDNAVEDYTRALISEPNNIHALHNRGICNQKLAKFNEVTLPHAKNLGY